MTLPPGIQALGEVRSAAHETFGIAATHTAADETETVTTLRLLRSGGELVGLMTDLRDRRSMIAFVPQADVADPQDGDTWIMAEGPWAGTWYQSGPPEATAAAEWRLLLTNERVDHTMDPDAGSPALGA